MKKLYGAGIFVHTYEGLRRQSVRKNRIYLMSQLLSINKVYYSFSVIVA